MPGPLELVILLGTLSPMFGIGIPIGLPPGESDPELLRMAPDSCVYATVWAGVATPDPKSPNVTERLLAEPELKAVIDHLVEVFQDSAREAADRSGNRQPLVVGQIVPQLGGVLFSRPAAIFVDRVAFGPDRLEVSASLIVNLGPERAAVAESLKIMRRELLQGIAEETEIDGNPFAMVGRSETRPEITWGIHGDYFMLGVGERAVQSVLDRRRTDPPPWIVDAAQRFQIERRATLTYANLNAVLDAAAFGEDRELVRRVINAAGVSGVGTYVSASGLDATDRVSKSFVEIEGDPRGLLAVLDRRGLEASDVASIPDDALVAVAARIDAPTAVEMLFDVVEAFDEGARDQITRELEVAADDIGFHVVRDLVGSLGDVWTIRATPAGGGLLTGWTMSVTLRDRDSLLRIEGAMRRDANVNGVEIVQRQVGDARVFSIAGEFDPLSPSWAIGKEELVIGLFPQAVAAHVHRPRPIPGLNEVPEVQRLFAAGPRPSMVSYLDTRAVFEAVYPMFTAAAQTLAGEMRSEFDIDVGILPPKEIIAEHLRPGTVTVRFVEGGVLTESHQSTPGGSLGASAPFLAAAIVPAISAARQASLRTQSINNVKQIMLAMLNYESANQVLPPAHSIDEDGKPLLSWRVYLLPYMDYVDLYEQFHLDEPWDSEHNRTLIPLMPEVFKAPGGLADPGKTNYLAISGEAHLMASKPQRGRGRQLREITDGLSNTISVVEVSDDLAAIWTKPGDFTPDQDNPINGLEGPRQGVFVAGFGDGSVQVISLAIDLDTLWAMFTHAGGEVVNR